MLGFNFRFQRSVSIEDITRNVIDMTTEITESTKLAEEYYAKAEECSRHIESCVRNIQDLASRLLSFNTRFAASARKSLCNARSSIDSLLSMKSSSRPVDSLQTAIPLVGPGLSDLSSTRQVSGRKNVTGVARRSRSAKRVSTCSVKDAVTTRSRSTVSRSQGASSTLQAVPPAAATPESSLGNQVEPIEAEFKSLQPQPRGSMQVRRRSTICTQSADSAVQSTLPSDVASSIETTAAAPPSSCLGNQVEPITAEFKSPQPQPRGRVQVRRRNTIRTKSADSAVQSSLPSDAASSGETTAVKTGRYKRNNSAAQNGVVVSHASAAQLNNVSDGVGSDDMFQPAILSNPSQESSESEVVKTRRRRRTNSAAGASTKKTSGGVVDGKVVSRRGGRSEQQQLAAGARRRNYRSPTSVIQSQRNTSAMNLNGAFPVAVDATSTRSSHSVTTYLSGCRTDIFKPLSRHSSVFAVQAVQSDGQLNASTVETEVTFLPAASADTLSVSATG